MNAITPPIFSFAEPDHLTRIHLRIGLEDLGFTIREHADDLEILRRADPAARPSAATPPRR